MVMIAARLPSSRSKGDLHAPGIRKYLHHGVGPQAAAFAIPASVKGRPNRLRDPPHVAVASNARCDRRGKPVKSIDYLTGKYRSRGTRIHVVHGHDNFVGGIIVNPDVELIIAENRRPSQRQRKAEDIDRSITSPTHSRYSKSQIAGQQGRRERGALPQPQPQRLWRKLSAVALAADSRFVNQPDLRAARSRGKRRLHIAVRTRKSAVSPLASA
jgi:hypothetical protein